MSKQETITLNSKTCLNGHDKSNSYINYRAETVCRICRYNRIRKYRQNKLHRLLNGNGGIL